MSWRVNFDDRLFGVYQEARAKSPETLKAWMDAIRKYVPDSQTQLSILDLGSGTGHFTSALASSFDAEVIGVEPADRMREVAIKANSSPAIQYVKGTGEQIPLPNSSIDLAWLSFVVHHLVDQRKCASELARVVRPGGRVFVRQVFPHNFDDATLFRYFPAARRIDEARTPSLVDFIATFHNRGLRFLANEPVTSVLDPDTQTYYERLKRRAISTLDLISDEDFEEGLAKLKDEADRETEPKPRIETQELVVFVNEA